MRAEPLIQIYANEKADEDGKRKGQSYARIIGQFPNLSSVFPLHIISGPVATPKGPLNLSKLTLDVYHRILSKSM